MVQEAKVKISSGRSRDAAIAIRSNRIVSSRAYIYYAPQSAQIISGLPSSSPRERNMHIDIIDYQWIFCGV